MASPLHAADGARTRKRRCPRCGHVQRVSPLSAQRSVECRRCGTSIPDSATVSPSPSAKSSRGND